jgi:hypothetical protein
MHPYISQALSAERIRDLRNEATQARRARLVRLAGHRRRDRHRGRAAGHLPPSGTPPGSYEDFLRITHAPLPREPSAAERARGQTVR